MHAARDDDDRGGDLLLPGGPAGAAGCVAGCPRKKISRTAAVISGAILDGFLLFGTAPYPVLGSFNTDCRNQTRIFSGLRVLQHCPYSISNFHAFLLCFLP